MRGESLNLFEAMLDTQRAAKIQDRINFLRERIYSRDFDPKELEELLKKPEYKDILDYITSKGILQNDIKSLDQVLSEYKDSLRNIPTVRIKLPQEGINQSSIYDWLKKNLLKNHDFILDVEVDESILGGIIVYWQGRIVDCSLKRKLSDYYVREARHVFE